MTNGDSPQEKAKNVIGWTAFLQPHPGTSVMQMIITASAAVAAVSIAIAASFHAVRNASDERNARLVEIGVSILKVDPAKETQVSAARKWALDLIDANAGGVRFSPEARAELLKNQLRAFDLGGGFDYSDSYSFDGPDQRPRTPRARLPLKNQEPPPQSN
jgi:hypothetical protein